MDTRSGFLLALVVTAALFSISCDPGTDVVDEEPPEIEVLSPMNLQMVDGSVRIAARCTDNGPAGCTSLQVASSPLFGTGSVLAEGTSEVDVALELPPESRSGYAWGIVFRAEDAAGHVRTQVVTVYSVEVPPAIEQVAELPGLVRDYDGTHATWVTDEDLSTALGGPWKIFRGRVTDGGPSGVWEAGPWDTHGEVPNAHVTDDGAFVEWHQTAGLWTSMFYGIEGAETVGSHALWLQARAGDYHVSIDWGAFGSGTKALWRGGGAEGMIEISPGGVTQADIAPDGTVVYRQQDTLFLFSQGQSTSLGPGSYPVTDGALIAYGRDGQLLVRQPGGQEEVVADGFIRTYDLRAGYLVYVRRGEIGRDQIWVRQPDGALAELDMVGSIEDVHCLTSAGDILFSTAEEVHRVSPPYTMADVELLYTDESGLPSPTCVDGEPYIFVGNAVLRL